MKKHLLSIAFVTLITATVQAQEHKIAKSTGRLDILEVNHITIEGTPGNEIIFSKEGDQTDQDSRAKGLRAISGSGVEDNTGLGLSVVDKGSAVEVQQLTKMDGPRIIIKVPKGVVVSFTHNSPHGDPVEFKNFEGEILVTSVHSGVALINVTGPLDIRTIHGDIDAALGATVKGPISLMSAHGHVDLALPLATKANLKLTTQFGEILVDPDFKIEIDKEGDMVRYDNKVNGKINGGGLDISLTAQHNKIYLRKKR